MPRDVDKLIDEMVSGLEGVTPGPWKSRCMGGDSIVLVPDHKWLSKYPQDERYPLAIPRTFQEEPDGKTEIDWSSAGFAHDDATHIARCSPDNIKAIAEAFRAQKARIAELEAQNERYVIWSHEHSAWWNPRSAGYTRSVIQAGIYDRKEALTICHQGRDGWLYQNSVPSEVPVRVADLPEFARTALQPEPEEG